MHHAHRIRSLDSPCIPHGGIDFPPYRPTIVPGFDMVSCPACRGQHKAHTCKKDRKRRKAQVLLDKDPNAVSQFNAVSSSFLNQTLWQHLNQTLWQPTPPSRNHMATPRIQGL